MSDPNARDNRGWVLVAESGLEKLIEQQFGKSIWDHITPEKADEIYTTIEMNMISAMEDNMKLYASDILDRMSESDSREFEARVKDAFKLHVNESREYNMTSPEDVKKLFEEVNDLLNLDGDMFELKEVIQKALEDFGFTKISIKGTDNNFDIEIKDMTPTENIDNVGGFLTSVLPFDVNFTLNNVMYTGLSPVQWPTKENSKSRFEEPEVIEESRNKVWVDYLNYNTRGVLSRPLGDRSTIYLDARNNLNQWIKDSEKFNGVRRPTYPHFRIMTGSDFYSARELYTTVPEGEQVDESRIEEAQKGVTKDVIALARKWLTTKRAVDKAQEVLEKVSEEYDELEDSFTATLEGLKDQTMRFDNLVAKLSKKPGRRGYSYQKGFDGAVKMMEKVDADMAEQAHYILAQTMKRGKTKTEIELESVLGTVGGWIKGVFNKLTGFLKSNDKKLKEIEKVVN